MEKNYIHILFETSIHQCQVSLLDLEIPFCFVFFLSLDLHELWHSVMNTCLFAEVKQEWATLALGWVTTSVHYSCF